MIKLYWCETYSARVSTVTCSARFQFQMEQKTKPKAVRGKKKTTAGAVEKTKKKPYISALNKTDRACLSCSIGQALFGGLKARPLVNPEPARPPVD